MLPKYTLVPLGAVSLLFAIAPTDANAASVLIKNASFEQDRLSDGGFVITSPPTGWSIGGNAGWQNPRANIFAIVPDGAQTGFIGGGGGPARGALQQVLGEGVVANSRYTLSVDIGRRPDVLLDDFVVELLSGATLLASGTYTNADIAAGQFRNLSLNYDSIAALAAPLTVRFRAIGKSSDYRQVNFDNVKLDYAAIPVANVPEPASWAMLVTGTGLAGAAMRRRRKANRLSLRAIS